jgi:hypothetical protein
MAAPRWASAQSADGVVVFGTSLSDSGNAFALTGDASTPPDFTLNPFLIPSAPYAKGGHHFSNGATWIEQYARGLGLGNSAGAALATDDPSATNFAVGAARAYNDGVNFNLSRQVDTFLLRTGGVASPQSLYVIEMGSNDIRDSFQIYATGGDGGPVLAQALGSIALNIQRLYVAVCAEFSRVGCAERCVDTGDPLAAARRARTGDVPDTRVQREPDGPARASSRPSSLASRSGGSMSTKS